MRIRLHGASGLLSPPELAELSQRAREGFEPFQRALRAVNVHLSAVRGTAGARRVDCRVTLFVHGGPELTLYESSAAGARAVAGALARAREALAWRLGVRLHPVDARVSA